MTVSETWMGTGAWSLRLRDDTPGTVIDALDWTKTAAAGLGHILIFPARTEAWQMSTADILARVKYTGVLLEWQDGFTIGGAGPGWWLGDSDDKGPLIETAITNTSAGLSTWLASLTPSSLNTGGVAGSGTTVTATFQWVTYRRALEAICAQNAASALPGCGWWVTPDMKLNVGGPDDVAEFGAMSPLIMPRFAGRDPNLLGVDVRSLDRAMDLREYVSKVRANGPGGLGTYSAASAYKDINGNTASIIAIVDVPTCPAGSESTAARTEYNARNATRRSIRLTSDTYDFHAVAASQLLTGSYVNVFAPELGLWDQTNEVYFQGMTVWPLKQQVLAQTWPIRSGYGVWFRGNDGTLTDLTDWVVWEDTTAATVDIGAPPRTLSNPSGLQGTVDVKQVGAAAANGAWATFTPALTASTTSPTLGTASTTTGSYRRDGSSVEGDAQITFGTAGVAAGSGTYRVSLPVAAARTGAAANLVGDGWMLDASTNQLVTFVLRTFPGSTTAEIYFTATTNFYATAAVPWTWAASDTIRYRFRYEASIT